MSVDQSQTDAILTKPTLTTQKRYYKSGELTRRRFLTPLQQIPAQIPASANQEILTSILTRLASDFRRKKWAHAIDGHDHVISLSPHPLYDRLTCTH